MKTIILSIAILVIVTTACFSFRYRDNNEYQDLYTSSVSSFNAQQSFLLDKINAADLHSVKDLDLLERSIHSSRLKLKAIDFWLRYLDPVTYKKINGPLPVEWETEVFEKFEKPYKRIGSGLTLAELYLSEENSKKDSLSDLIRSSINAVRSFQNDSVMKQLDRPDHFFLANRLFLLNLSAIYTTGFECPDTSQIIPELRSMLLSVKHIYDGFGQSFPETPLSKEYLELYDKAISFVDQQPSGFSNFDHYIFIKEFVNPLFAINQQFIRSYNIVSKNFNDYSLNNNCNSVFDKSLYRAQNTKGIYSLVEDPAALAEIRATGKKLFYDPILSGNNSRSCASCHKSGEYFTDTLVSSALQFDKQQRLPRNTPSLINAGYNHLVLLNGKHTSLSGQGRDVMTNPNEMNSNEKELLDKVLSCKEYKTAFKDILKLTPEKDKITLDHIISCITFYYGSFSNYYAPFDEAMNNKKQISESAKKGFNLFMSKAQCATCHFVPQFNGVKPPYIGSEFEVLGVPDDSLYSKLNADKGRFDINPAPEMLHAFRTGSIRNAQYTGPYMHNGVFTTLDQVIEFYNAGGGTGKKLEVDNQTLSSDSLKLSTVEKKELIAFIYSLNENIIFEKAPDQLPASRNKKLNGRKPGGDY